VNRTLLDIAPPKTLVGHYVLKAKPVQQGDGEYPNCVVLCYSPTDYQQFVTWVAYLQDDKWCATWGHYYADVVDAVADFVERT
jgi:hypothetical protein